MMFRIDSEKSVFLAFQIGLNGRKNVKNILIYRRKNVILQSLFVQKNVIIIYETAVIQRVNKLERK